VSDDNVTRLREALILFAFKDEDLPIEAFKEKGNIITFGIAPTRVDFLNEIDGVSYEDASKNVVQGKYGKVEVTFIGFNDLVKNKQSTERTRDKADAEVLLRQKDKIDS
jgi:hypothetical protein